MAGRGGDAATSYGPLANVPTPLAVGASDLPTAERAVLRGHEGAVLAVRFNADGNYLLTCGQDRTLRLWNPHKGGCGSNALS